MNTEYSFSKSERLTSDKDIEALMKNGNSFLVYPFKVSFLPRIEDAGTHVKVLINASKKQHPKATDRNLLKRQTREAFRKNKHILYQYLENQGTAINLALVYIGKEIFSSEKTERKIILALHRLCRKEQ